MKKNSFNFRLSGSGKDEAGVASGYQVGVIAVLLVLVLLLVGSLQNGQKQLELQVKADAVALAGAQALIESVGMERAGENACRVAEEVAVSNQVSLLKCEALNLQVRVWVGSGFKRAQARAGVESDLLFFEENTELAEARAEF